MPDPTFRDRALNLDPDAPDPTALTDLLVDMVTAVDKLRDQGRDIDNRTRGQKRVGGAKR